MTKNKLQFIFKTTQMPNGNIKQVQSASQY